ncbi:MAG: hypothetical protein KGV58_00005 [Campylobacteraceae bacterium]|nr:hypothetical protein [Campylobacteraceae bacterium]
MAGNRINVTGVTVTSGVFTPNGLKGKRVFEGVEDYGSFIATCSGVQEFSGTKAYPI